MTIQMPSNRGLVRLAIAIASVMLILGCNELTGPKFDAAGEYSFASINGEFDLPVTIATAETQEGVVAAEIVDSRLVIQRDGAYSIELQVREFTVADGETRGAYELRQTGTVSEMKTEGAGITKGLNFLPGSQILPGERLVPNGQFLPSGQYEGVFSAGDGIIATPGAGHAIRSIGWQPA